MVEAPNCAPSLCSVAGLLLALALQSGYEDALTLLPTGIRDWAARSAASMARDLPHRAGARRAKLGFAAQTCRAAIRADDLGTAMLRRYGLPTVEDLEISQRSRAADVEDTLARLTGDKYP